MSWPETGAPHARGSFDRRFLRAIEREVAARGDCQSSRLLNRAGLAEWMARSPWATARDGAGDKPHNA